MAQLKDSVIAGNLRVTDEVLADTVQARIVSAPTTSGGAVYGSGSAGQILTSNGTSSYWANDAMTIAYGTCDTAADVAKKVATLSNTNWELKEGSVIAIKFANSNSASSCTLNVNNTGDKSIWYNNDVYTSTSGTICGYANRYNYYMYDGTYWVWVNAGTEIDTTSTVTQNAVSSTNGAYCILHANNTGTAAKGSSTVFKAACTYNPSTKAFVSNGTVDGLTLAPQTTGFKISGGTTSKTLTVGADYTLGAACAKGVTDNSSATAVTSSDTNLITGRTLYNAGYTKNTGTVTSITLKKGDGIALDTDNTAITTSGTRTISLATSGATAGSYGPSAAVTGNEGSTMNVPYITVDKYGRITAISNKVYTAKNTTYSNATTSAAGLMSSTDKSHLDNITTVDKVINNLVTGTGTAGQAGSSTVDYVPSLWKFNLNFTPKAGDTIMIKIPVAGVSSGIWMSVDNGSHYYPVAFVNKSRMTTQYGVNSIIELIYEEDAVTTIYGTSTAGAEAGSSTADYTSDRWVSVNNYYTNTTYTNASLGQGYGTCATAASTTEKAVTLSSYALTTGGIVVVKFTYDVPANATMNINSKGAKYIYYNGAKITAGIIKAGDFATFVYSSYYHLIAIHRTACNDELPAVTASDNGKFLQVVSGEWAAVSVDNANGVSF